MNTYAHLMNSAKGMDATIRDDPAGIAVDISRFTILSEWAIVETRVFTGEGAFYRAEAWAKHRLA